MNTSAYGLGIEFINYKSQVSAYGLGFATCNSVSYNSISYVNSIFATAYLVTYSLAISSPAFLSSKLASAPIQI